MKIQLRGLLLGVWMGASGLFAQTLEVGLPSRVDYDGGKIAFRPVSSKKAERMLAKRADSLGSGFSMGTLPEGYESVEVGGKQGFRLHLENGTSLDFLSDPASTPVPDGVADGELQEWTFVSWARTLGWAFLSASGHQEQGNCLVSLENGRCEWICATPQINATGNWVVAANDYTESGERGSCFEVLRLDGAGKASVLLKESEVEGYEFLGWITPYVGVVRVWFRKNDMRVGRYFKMGISEGS